MSTSLVIDCQQLGKSYDQGKQKLTVLQGVSFQVFQGESVAIMGASGAGKSTLLNLMGGLDRCDEGHIRVMGHDLATLADKQLTKLRNQHIGFVYQFHHLLSEFDASENVAMPLLIRGMKKQMALMQAETMLARVGLANRSNHRPYELSGGERQRVAIARALVAEPSVVLMDEPTGNLDEQTALTIQSLLIELNRDIKTSFIIVTHDKSIAMKQERILSLHDGKIHEVKRD